MNLELTYIVKERSSEAHVAVMAPTIGPRNIRTGVFVPIF